MLEREPVIMPKYHWDNSDPMSCAELVYGTGDIFRTGAAAGPGNVEEQWEAGANQNEFAGPIQADFLRLVQGAQGTMGLVTWSTVRCEHAPSIEEPYLVGASRLDDLLDFIHWLIRNRMADDCLVLNNVNMAHILSNKTASNLEDIKSTLPPWILFFTLSGLHYFPEEKLSYLRDDMSRLAQSCGVVPRKELGIVSALDIMRVLHGISEEPYWKMRYRGSCHDIFFITIQDHVSHLVKLMQDLAAKYEYAISDMGAYIQPIVQGVNYHCEFNFFFDPNNTKEKAKIAGLSEEAFLKLSHQGAFFSRPYHPWTDMAFRTDAETTIALRKVKKIFDPNQILNPGKLCF